MLRVWIRVRMWRLSRNCSFFFFSSRRRHTRYWRDWSSDVCSSDLLLIAGRGHACGDQILRQFGARLQHSLRRGVDWVARIGGEEFAIVLPETGYQQGLDVARKLRAAIAQPPFKPEGKSVDVTASFGLCGLDRVPAGERRLPDL